MRYPIALKFGTQKGGIKAHLGTNIGWNTINRQRVMSDYARKITPICCHAYRVNRVWEEAEYRWVNRLTIEPQTFCGLKEIELKTRKIERNNQQCVTITQSRLANYYYYYCSIPYAYFVPYAYGTYHMRIRVRYNHTRMVRKIVPSEYS